MHYRICWASKCESECTDGIGSSPCAVIVPVDKKYDGVIGQWTDNGLSPLDADGHGWFMALRLQVEMTKGNMRERRPANRT